MDKCKLGVISHEWLNIEIKLYLRSNRMSYYYAASISTTMDSYGSIFRRFDIPNIDL